MGEGNARTPPSAATTQHVADLLTQAERGVTRRISAVLKQEGCTVARWRILVLLADGASHPMSAIAESALLPAPTLTRLIDRMVADNLAYRKADPQDRRRVLVHITPRGRALRKRLGERIEASQAAILAQADVDDLAELTALLADLVDRLRQAGAVQTDA